MPTCGLLCDAAPRLPVYWRSLQCPGLTVRVSSKTRRLSEGFASANGRSKRPPPRPNVRPPRRPCHGNIPRVAILSNGSEDLDENSMTDSLTSKRRSAVSDQQANASVRAENWLPAAGSWGRRARGRIVNLFPSRPLRHSPLGIGHWALPPTRSSHSSAAPDRPLVPLSGLGVLGDLRV